jgi:hypothetical protein
MVRTRGAALARRLGLDSGRSAYFSFIFVKGLMAWFSLAAPAATVRVV